MRVFARPILIRQLGRQLGAVRRYASKPKSPMGEWYSHILPAMLPISLLASAVYTGLLLAQLTLSHEKTMEEQATRLVQLEAEVDALHRARKSTQ